MTDEGLFALDPGWVAPAGVDPQAGMTAGERRRARQAQAMTSGLHPLTLTPGTRPIRLHPDVRGQEATRENAAARPLRCGTCRWREYVHGGARSYPKCVIGAPTYPNGNPAYDRAPRVSHGDNTDCAAWWPACVDYQAKPEEAPDA